MAQIRSDKLPLELLITDMIRYHTAYARSCNVLTDNSHIRVFTRVKMTCVITILACSVAANSTSVTRCLLWT